MTDLHFRTFGDGSIDILLIHGWASSSRMWENITPHFTNVRFWAVDLAGFGQTPIGDHAPTIPDHVASVRAFCQKHALQPQVIIAHSMGGLVTLQLMHEHPELAQQLVLIAPVVTGLFGLQGVASVLLRTGFGAAAFRRGEIFWKLVQQEPLLKTVVPPWHTDAGLAQRVQEDFLAVVPQAGIEALVSMAQQDSSPFLTEIQQPTLICVGNYDLTVPPTEAETAAMYIPNAQFVRLDQARHHPHDEQSADFLPILKDFLAKFGIL